MKGLVFVVVLSGLRSLFTRDRTRMTFDPVWLCVRVPASVVTVASAVTSCVEWCAARCEETINTLFFFTPHSCLVPCTFDNPHGDGRTTEGNRWRPPASQWRILSVRIFIFISWRLGRPTSQTCHFYRKHGPNITVHSLNFKLNTAFIYFTVALYFILCLMYFSLL